MTRALLLGFSLAVAAAGAGCSGAVAPNRPPRVVIPATPPAPPDLGFVPVPPGQEGRTYVQGQWLWNGQSWIWMRGYWTDESTGQRFVPGHWVANEHGTFRWEQPHWERVHL